MINWKDIKGYEGVYQISDEGQIKILPRYRKTMKTYSKERMKPVYRNWSGYLRVQLSKDKVNKIFSVHRLVAEAFIPNTANKATINHVNNNKADNRVENLEWATMKEQHEHAIKFGNRQVGEKNPMAKYSDDFILGFKLFYNRNNLSVPKVANRFGVSLSWAYKILKHNFRDNNFNKDERAA